MEIAIQNQAIEIYPDYTRRLPVADAHDRELWISLGCALENLLVAAGALGYATGASYPAATDVIRVRLAKGTARGSLLFNAIPLRQNTCSSTIGSRSSAPSLISSRQCRLSQAWRCRLSQTRAI
ncbi:MAG: hypothetical protein U0Z44_06020 [Kouleothrix sp.]